MANTAETLQTVVGFITAGGRYLGHKKMRDLKAAIIRVLKYWKEPGTFECMICPFCSGNGWFARQNESLDGSLGREEVACATCSGHGKLYRVSHLSGGHRDKSKGARHLIDQGVSRYFVEWA